MLGKRMNDALNEQINAEFYSSYLYLSMAAWFAAEGLKGCENWMKIQAQEELTHAMKLFDYVNERGGKVLISAIECPDTSWSSPLEVFEATCAHEAKVTALFNDLMNLALEERDFASQTFLQWFISEQVEEEASAGEVKSRFEMAGDSKPAVLMLDKELASRVFSYPPQSTGE